MSSQRGFGEVSPAWLPAPDDAMHDTEPGAVPGFHMSEQQGGGSPVELMMCVGGIYFCYLYYGVLQ
eukprot:2052379-Rhodomonas_salina.3